MISKNGRKVIYTSNKALEKMIEEKVYYDGISQCWSIREKDIKEILDL